MRYDGATRTVVVAYSLKDNNRDLTTEMLDSNRPIVFQLLGQITSDTNYVVTRCDLVEFTHSLHAKGPARLFQALGQSNLLLLGKSLLSESRPIRPGEKTVLLGIQIFLEANLGDCCHYKLAKLAATGTGTDIENIKTALKGALDTRIGLRKRLLSFDRSNQYFRTLLAVGYFNRAKTALEDKIPGISEEEAQKNLRFAFCLALPIRKMI